MGRVALNEQDEAFVRRQLETGRYSDATEVVQAALQLMKDFEQDHEWWLRETIPSRYAEVQRDPSKAVPLAAARARFETMRRANSAES